MDIWELFISIISMGLLLSSILIFIQSRKSKSIIKIHFSLFILLFSLIHFILFLIGDPYSIIPAAIENVSSLMFSVVIISIPPAIYNYVILNIDKKNIIDLKIFRISYVLTSINIISFIYFTAKPMADDFLFEVIENVMNYSNFISFIFIFPGITVFYLLKIIMVIKKSNAFKKESILEFITHFQYISIGYFVFISLYLSSNYIDNALFLFSYRIFTILYISILFIIIKIYLTEKSYFSEEIIEGLNSQKSYGDISDKINKLIFDEKPYLDPKITIYQLAKMLDTNEKYLSNYLNETHHLNFYNYINQFRIEYAKELLVDPIHENYTIETIANLSGFHSKSSFNAAFKKETGETPSTFKKKIKTE